MTAALWLLALQGLLGASDTLYYHEWRARLPALGAKARPELLLHAARDFIYAILFATLAWLDARGSWALALAALLAAEIVITLTDFVVEDRIRKPLGGVHAGERAMHAVMGIVYGAMLAHLIPALFAWWRASSALARQEVPVSDGLRCALTVMAVGVAGSGVRDVYAAFDLPYGAFPWKRRARDAVPS
jgi:hypothetical protein